MGELLQQTINLYSESWKKDHEAVMANYKRADAIKEQVDFGIFLFDRLLDALHQGATDNTSGVAPMVRSMTAWYEGSSRALRDIQTLDKEGFTVENTEALRERHRRAGAILEELQDAQRACNALRTGTSIGVEQFLNELQN
jgi:hypothetical protein